MNLNLIWSVVQQWTDFVKSGFQFEINILTWLFDNTSFLTLHVDTLASFADFNLLQLFQGKQTVPSELLNEEGIGEMLHFTDVL